MLANSEFGVRTGLVATPGQVRSVDSLAWRWAGAALLLVLAVGWVLLAGARQTDPLARRVTAELQLHEGPEVSVLRCDGVRDAWVGDGAVSFRCQVFVDGRRAGEGIGVLDGPRGSWSMYYEFAGQGDGLRHVGQVGGPLQIEVSALAPVD